MMKLLNKAKNIVKDAMENGISLDFNVEINNDKPLSYKDILFNLDELNNVKKAKFVKLKLKKLFYIHYKIL